MEREKNGMEHSGIWNLLNEYADIRDELESLQEHLSTCNNKLQRFKRPEGVIFSVSGKAADILE